MTGSMIFAWVMLFLLMTVGVPMWLATLGLVNNWKELKYYLPIYLTWLLFVVIGYFKFYH